MLHLEDKITAAVIGPIKAGKGIFTRKAQEPHHQKILLDTVLEGNYWVPKKFHSIEEHPDNDFLARYYANPQRYALEFQIKYMAVRLEQQSKVDQAEGIVFTGQPLDIDKLFAEINKDNIGEAYPTHLHLFEQVQKRVTSPDIMIYLKVTDPEILQQRIRAGHRSGEEVLLGDSSYLSKNIESLERYCAELKKPLITIDASHPAFDGEWDQSFWTTLFQRVAAEMRSYKKPPRLAPEEWAAVDHNRARRAASEIRRQLRHYLQEHQTIITIAGIVGAGKTGLAELFEDELEIKMLRELQGKNDQVADNYYAGFLDSLKYKDTNIELVREACYRLQDYLVDKRPRGRIQLWQQGDSFCEDRTPVEDQSIFWRLFLAEGWLTQEQFNRLQEKAKRVYAQAPKSDYMVLLRLPAAASRTRILERGRPSEIAAWPPAVLQKMESLYTDFLSDMKQYGSHDGPTQEIDFLTFETQNERHKAYLYQEMHHGMMEYRASMVR